MNIFIFSKFFLFLFFLCTFIYFILFFTFLWHQDPYWCPLKKNKCMTSLIIRTEKILTNSQLALCWHHLRSVIIILTCCGHDWLTLHSRDWVTNTIIVIDLIYRILLSQYRKPTWVPLKHKYSCIWEMTHCVSGVAVSSKRNFDFIFIRTNWDVYSIRWKHKLCVIRLSLLSISCPPH